MRAITKNLVEFLKKEDGPTAVEYAVMLALIVVVCIAAITTLGQNANSTFSFVAQIDHIEFSFVGNIFDKNASSSKSYFKNSARRGVWLGRHSC
jgi:pilus assembly protein Flp/PilA